jgi:tetratricopeptide (TPR) repeat protein
MKNLTRLVIIPLLAGFAGTQLVTDAGAVRNPISKPSAETSQVKKCKKGEIWNKKKKACIKTESGMLPDSELLAQATILADAGQYERALEVLALAANPRDPEILGLQGYSHRKAGRLETGISYYRQALAIAPDHVRVREYLGEGYALAGHLDLARVELAEIASRCGESCMEYKLLLDVIETETFAE